LSWDPGVLIVALATMVAFVATFHFSGLIRRARSAVATVSQTLAVMSRDTLDDEEKERLVQRAALRMFGQFALITVTIGVVFLVPAAVIWVGDLTGLAPVVAVSNFLLSWEVIIGATVLVLASVWLARRR
jgi:hypothetical protein